ncbi:integrase, catalytic region, zinc finger, CCHC-type containing protein [Tanacetum coccineum]
MATERLDADLQGTPTDQTTYRRMIGGLMYLTDSRPDIAFATFVCARYQARPTVKHLKEDSGFELISYSDTDYARCKDDCKNTLGGLQFLGGKLVSWSSKKQDCTAMSTAEAEYVSLSACLDSFNDLFDYLQQFEKLVNASRAKKLEKSHDPLALDDVHNNSEDPLVSAMLLLTKAITQNFSNLTNNHSLCLEEVVEGMNAPKETGNVQRTLRTPSSGNTSTVQCYNCSGKGHYARNCPKPRVRDSKYFMEQMLLAKQDEAGVILTDEVGIQPADHTSDDGPSYEGNVNSGSVEKDTHVPDLCAVEKLARNAYQEAEKQRIFAQQVQTQNTHLTSQLEMYKERVWILENITSLVVLEIPLNVRDSEDTLEDAFKSQQKMTEKMNDPIAVANKQNCWTINYKKLNALYKDFVPQKELSVEQKYFPSSSIPSVKILVSKNMPSESPLIKELDKIKVCFEKLSLLIQQNCKRASIFYTSPAEIQINDFCQDQVKPILNELKVYLEFFQNLFQRDIKEMKDVFESTESELDELEKQNDLLKDQLLEASLKQDVELCVLINHECVDKILNAELEKVKKKSFEIQEGLQARIKILEKDVQRCEKQSVDFQLKLQHEKEKQKWDSTSKNKTTIPLDYSWISKMEKLRYENVSLILKVQS